MAKLYQLMNKDRAVLTFEADEVMDSFRIVGGGDRGQAPLPLGFTDMGSFLEGRRAPKHRAHIARLLTLCQCNTLCGYLEVTRALSLNDTFWCKPASGDSAVGDLTWADVSLYENPFDDVVARLAFEGGLYGELLSTTSPEFGTDGSFAKCWIRRDGDILLLKGGHREWEDASYEPWSEAMAYQVARALGLEAVPYHLVSWRGHDGRRSPATTCPLFTSERTGFVSASRFFGTGNASVARLLHAYADVGSEGAFRRTVVLDALTLNPDRHMGNHGFLVDNDTLEVLGMAPVFDNNLAFCPGYSDAGMDGCHAWARQTLRPKIGDDFNLVAHELLTPAIRKDLVSMTDFTFDCTALAGMPSARIDALEDCLHIQAQAVLQGAAFNEAPEPVEEDLSWQLEDWPEDQPEG